MKLIEPIVRIWQEEMPWFIPFVETMLKRLFPDVSMPINCLDLVEHRTLRLSDLTLSRLPFDQFDNNPSIKRYETDEVCYLLGITGNIIGEVGSPQPDRDAFAYSHRENVWECAERLKSSGINIDDVCFVVHASAERRAMTLLYIPRLNTWSQFVNVLLAEYRREVVKTP